MSKVTDKLAVVLADTYTLYLKTQNYHWHVTGPNFKTLHELFEEQYTLLADAVDDLAERIRTLGELAPATFSQFGELATISEGNAKLSPAEMVAELYEDHGKLLQDLNTGLGIAQEQGDEGTVAMLSERIAAHEKIRWMLGASR